MLTGSDKRMHPRKKMDFKVFVCHPQVGRRPMKTRDMSDSGVYVQGHLANLPQEGSVVEVKVDGMLGDGTPGVPMKVVRGDSDGVALRFV